MGWGWSQALETALRQVLAAASLATVTTSAPLLQETTLDRFHPTST